MIGCFCNDSQWSALLFLCNSLVCRHVTHWLVSSEENMDKGMGCHFHDQVVEECDLRLTPYFLSLSPLVYWLWGSQGPYWSILYGEAHEKRSQRQSLANSQWEIRPWAPQPTRNWMLSTTTQVGLEAYFATSIMWNF